MSLIHLAAFVSVAVVTANLVSILVAGWRLRPYRTAPPPGAGAPPVSIVIPCRGLEAFTGETLERAFRLDWPRYELIFCVEHSWDAVVPAIREALAKHPGAAARLLIGEDRVSGNPKLNNCVKGWKAAASDWVILADSNVLMPPDYVQQLMSAWRADSGLVCSTPIGCRPEGFWAEVECAFLNTMQARWQYAGEALGLGFAQGKSMLWKKSLLDAHGGICALASEIAEDAAATKLVNGLGLHVHLVPSPFGQPLGRRTLQEVWSRQVRWARLRRVTFPLFFAPEILTGCAVPFALALLAASEAEAGLWSVAPLVLLLAYLPEYALALAKGWHASPLLIPAMLVRDCLQPAVWLRGWIGGAIEWRGNAMIIRPRSADAGA